jgi:hypothetical protein
LKLTFRASIVARVSAARLPSARVELREFKHFDHRIARLAAGSLGIARPPQSSGQSGRVSRPSRLTAIVISAPASTTEPSGTGVRETASTRRAAHHAPSVRQRSHGSGCGMDRAASITHQARLGTRCGRRQVFCPRRSYPGVLQSAGYTIDYVAGSSMGAVVGVWLALGMAGPEIKAMLRQHRTSIR